jgi:hypothetical protein
MQKISLAQDYSTYFNTFLNLLSIIYVDTNLYTFMEITTW